MHKLLMAVSMALLTVGLSAAEVVGKVEFLTKRGQKPKVEETIVWLEPIDAPSAKKLEPGDYVVVTRKKTIVPHVMIVPAGSTVTFPNEDAITHNLFSVSKPNDFDLGLYKRGTAESHTFDEPGIVNVYCNVHPEMSAVIHVVSSPYHVPTDKNGSFRLEDVEEGLYRLVAWNEVGGSVSTDLEVSGSGVVEAPLLKIDGRKHRAERHLNKEGKPYKRQRSSEY